MGNRYAFIGGNNGPWHVQSMAALKGSALPAASTIAVYRSDDVTPIPAADWILNGVISNVRYATRSEVASLKSSQEPLNRSRAKKAALIPIKKSAAWWDLAQDERRAIFEEKSHHGAIGMGYLPAVARQLYHCRDIGEPFDFLTWFEYAEDDASAFNDLLSKLRETPEWDYVEREIDIRLERD